MKKIMIAGIVGMLILLSGCSITTNVVKERTGYCDYREFEGEEVYFCKSVRTCNFDRDCRFLDEKGIEGRCIDRMCLRYCLDEEVIEC